MFPSNSPRPWIQYQIDRTTVGWILNVEVYNCCETFTYCVPLKSLEAFKIMTMLWPKDSWAGISRESIDKEFYETWEKVKDL